MCYLKSICFVCLSTKPKLNAVYRNEIFTHVKYALPELTNLKPLNPVSICSSCHTTLRSFSMFKRKCLENYEHLNDHIKMLQESKNTPGQSNSVSQITFINCGPLVKNEKEINFNKQLNEDPLQLGQKTATENNIEVKEELLESDVSTDRDFYQRLVQSDSVTNEEENGGSSVSSALHNNEVNSNTDTDSQVFQCSMCIEVFSDKLMFDTHLRNHIDNIKNLQCPICSKTFSRKGHLTPHMKAHLGIKDFECKICKKKFGHNNDMKRHLKVHEGIKAYECSICKRTFTQNSHLKLHIKIHKGIKDCECKICNKKFRDNGNLRKHMNIHEGIKNYECSICKRAFTQNPHLKAHLKRHERIKEYEVR